MLVAMRPMEPDEFRGKRIAVPGKLTSAYLALKLIEPDFEASAEVVDFAEARQRLLKIA